MLQPVGGLQVGQPVRLLDAGVHHFPELPQGLPHHVDVVDVQKHQLRVLVRVLALIATTLGLAMGYSVGSCKGRAAVAP